MKDDLIILSRGPGPFRTRAFLAAALLSALWLYTGMALAVVVIASDADLSQHSNFRQFSMAEMLLSAGFRGFLGWSAIYAVFPFISGWVTAALSPKAEYFNAIFPISFVVIDSVANVFALQGATLWSYAALSLSCIFAIAAVLAGTRFWARRRRAGSRRSRGKDEPA